MADYKYHKHWLWEKGWRFWTELLGHCHTWPNAGQQQWTCICYYRPQMHHQEFRTKRKTKFRFFCVKVLMHKLFFNAAVERTNKMNACWCFYINLIPNWSDINFWNIIRRPQFKLPYARNTFRLSLRFCLVIMKNCFRNKTIFSFAYRLLHLYMTRNYQI